MVYGLIDDWLYLDFNGKTGIYGRQETDRNLKSKIKTITAAFLDCQTKSVSLIGQQATHQEALVGSAFPEGFIAVQEKLSTDTLQVMGAPQEKIEDIYRYFSGICIEKLVPYAVAIRAFLKSKNLLDPYPYVVFLDDLKNQAVLTFFEGMRWGAPRRISMRDTGYMITEIKRSWQSFATDMNSFFVLISNNQQWLEAFGQEGFLPKGNMIYVESEFAVLEGLKSAKFTIHFAPTQEILRKKKNQLWKIRLKTFTLSALLVSLGLGFLMTANIYQHQMLLEYRHLLTKANQYKSQLKDLTQQKFLNLKHSDPIDYPKIYYDFVRCAPADYRIDSFQFQKDNNPAYGGANGTWNFKGVIVPQDESATQAPTASSGQARFVRQFSFAKAEVACVVVNKVLGQQISLRINKTDSPPLEGGDRGGGD